MSQCLQYLMLARTLSELPQDSVPFFLLPFPLLVVVRWCPKFNGLLGGQIFLFLGSSGFLSPHHSVMVASWLTQSRAGCRHLVCVPSVSGYVLGSPGRA